MDVFFDLLKQLMEALGNPMVSVLALTLICLASVGLARFMVKAARKRGGFWSFISGGEKEKEPNHEKHHAELKELLGIMIRMQTDLGTKISEGFVNNEKYRDNSVEEINRIVDGSTQQVEKFIEDIKHALQLGDLNASTYQASNKDLLKMVLELLTAQNKISVENHDIAKTCQAAAASALSHMEKLEEFLKTSIPEVNNNHREITKALSELSTDIALIERTIQTTIIPNGIKLR